MQAGVARRCPGSARSTTAAYRADRLTALCASDRAWATFTQHRLEARRLIAARPKVNARVEPRAPRDRVGMRQRAKAPRHDPRDTQLWGAAGGPTSPPLLSSRARHVQEGATGISHGWRM